MQSPRVAIITRTKNRAALLRRAVDSILAQTFPDWMHWVVNDGGDPGPVEELLAGYRDRYQGRLGIIHNPTSLGMEAASNVGIRAGTSKYLVIHDDDDTWQPEFLARCVAYLDAPPPALHTPIAGVICYSTRILEEFDGQTAKEVSRAPFNTWMNGVSLYRLAASNCFPPISFVFSRAAMEDVGLFREDLPVLGDWDFHLRFAARYEIGLIREQLANYHHRMEVTSGDYGNSVVAGDDKHRRYDHLLRNDLLRQDLAAGRPGLGMLVNVANSFEILHLQLNQVQPLWQRLRGFRLARWLYRKLKG